MAIIRDTNLWLAEIMPYDYYESYEDILLTENNTFNWIIEQEIRGVLMSHSMKSAEIDSIIASITRDNVYLVPDISVLKTIKEVYEKCRIAADTKQDVKDIYIAGYAVYYDIPIVTHDLEFTRLKAYEPRLDIITNRSGALGESHPRSVFSPNIDTLDDYMVNTLQAREIELASGC